MMIDSNIRQISNEPINVERPKTSLFKKFKNVFHLFVVFIKSTLNLSNYKITHIDPDNLSPELMEKLKKFESSFVYPFSDEEKFRIEHGAKGNYFDFFKQLGKVHFCIAICKKDETITKQVNGKTVTIQRKAGEIAAAGCAVLRTMPLKNGKTTNAWYFCDLKVGKDFQGEHIPLMMFQKNAWRVLQCAKGYGICMNPPDNKPRAAEIWKKVAPISGTQVQTLNLFTVSSEDAQKKHQDIKDIYRVHHKNPFLNYGYTTTEGVKDYKIFSDKNPSRPWNLCHLVARESFSERKDFTHMFASVEGSELDKSLKDRLKIAPSSTAQIVSYGMETVDFNLLTSNQI